MFLFLEVDPDVSIDSSRKYNAAGVPRSISLNRLIWPSVIAAQSLVPRSWRGSGILANLIWKTYQPAPALGPEFRRRLRETYREDILRTSELIDRDLSHWLG